MIEHEVEFKIYRAHFTTTTTSLDYVESFFETYKGEESGIRQWVDSRKIYYNKLTPGNQTNVDCDTTNRG